MQQRLQWRACRLHAAVLEVLPRDPRLGLHDRVHARGKLHDVLLLRAQHLFCEYRRRSLEDPPQEAVDEKRCDAVAQAAGQYGAAVQAEIGDLFQVAVRLEEFGVALLHPHAAPDLRNQQADVVVHAELRSDVARPMS